MVKKITFIAFSLVYANIGLPPFLPFNPWVMLNWLYRKKFLILVGLSLGILTGYFLWIKEDPGPVYDRAPVEVRDLVEEVSVTGTVETDSEMDLKFQRSGTLKSIEVEVGDSVTAGQVLAKLDTTSFNIELNSARSDLSMARANYNQAVAGSTQEAMDVAEAAVEKAERDVQQAEQNLENARATGKASIQSVETAYDSAQTDYDNAVTSTEESIVHAYENAYYEVDSVLNTVEVALQSADSILGVDNSEATFTYESALSSSGSSHYNARQRDYQTIQSDYETLKDTYSETEKSDFDAVESVLSDAEDLLDSVTELLSDIDDLLFESPVTGAYTNDIKQSARSMMTSELSTLSTASFSLSQAFQAIETAQTTQETSLNTAQSALDQAEQNLEEATTNAEANENSAKETLNVYESVLAQAKANLEQVEAGPRSVDLAALSAAIDKAEAAVELAEYNLSLCTLTAPREGVVIELPFHVGETISTADSLLTLISPQYQITANVSETDIAKVQVGDWVYMTLDAFSYDKAFEAVIMEIDPSETVVQGVIYYQVKAAFTANDPEVKPGMTANMDIRTAEAPQALVIPLRAVKYDGAREYVLKWDAVQNAPVEVDVQTGIRDDQYVQILAGLELGDQVVTYVR